MEIDVRGDWFSLVSYQADLDLSNVYVAFNFADNWLPLSAIGAGVFTPFERVYIRAAQSEVGKSLSIAVGGQARFYISAQGVTISNDLVGLAREYTLAQISTSAAGVYAIASSNVNYPLSTMASVLSSINSYSANINAILTTNVNAPLSGIQNTLNQIEANATSINAVVTANVNYPLSTMAATLNSINSYSANINGILSSNINYPMNKLRWGYPAEPIWAYSAIATGPLAAGTVLLSQPVSSGYSAYIWGYFLSENDPNGNVFLIQWVNGTTVYQQMVVMNGPGTINFISVKAINDGLPASPNTTMTVKILNAASTNALYMAGILYGQVP
jgi:flagellar basal body rod protein FlgC